MPRSGLGSSHLGRPARRREAVPRRSALLAVVMTGPLSQLGHLLAYLLHYGGAARPRQSMGAHAYFPLVAKTSAGAAGLLVLGALAAAGVAALLRARRATPAERAPGIPVLRLLAVLLPLQLAIFTMQEAAELTATGQLRSLADLPLLWGLAGQVPVACLAAVFLHWASIAVTRAARGLSMALAAASGPAPLVALVAAPPVPAPAPAAPAAGPMAGRKRGPPRPALAA
jgi:hypothetical protein